MIRTGRVAEVRQNKLMICFERLEACQNCGACASEKRKVLIEVDGEAEIGDTVDVMMPDAQVVKASALAYIVPLTALLIGLWVGNQLFAGLDIAVLLSGILLMFLSWGGLRLLDIRLHRRQAWKPMVIAVRKVLNSNDSNE